MSCLHQGSATARLHESLKSCLFHLALACGIRRPATWALALHLALRRLPSSCRHCSAALLCPLHHNATMCSIPRFHTHGHNVNSGLDQSFRKCIHQPLHAQRFVTMPLFNGIDSGRTISWQPESLMEACHMQLICSAESAHRCQRPAIPASESCLVRAIPRWSVWWMPAKEAAGAHDRTNLLSTACDQGCIPKNKGNICQQLLPAAYLTYL